MQAQGWMHTDWPYACDFQGLPDLHGTNEVADSVRPELRRTTIHKTACTPDFARQDSDADQ